MYTTQNNFKVTTSWLYVFIVCIIRQYLVGVKAWHGMAYSRYLEYAMVKGMKPTELNISDYMKFDIFYQSIFYHTPIDNPESLDPT